MWKATHSERGQAEEPKATRAGGRDQGKRRGRDSKRVVIRVARCAGTRRLKKKKRHNESPSVGTGVNR